MINFKEPRTDTLMEITPTKNITIDTIYPTSGGVCSKEIDISIKNDIILSVSFIKGCPGNTEGLSKLLVGMEIHDVVNRLEGIKCAENDTSCPDQLAKALKSIIENYKKK